MKPELLPLAVIIMTSAIMPARAQTPPGTTINLAVPLAGTSFANAELFQTDVSGGGLNGPGAAQVTLHLIDVKPNWDNTTLPATGEVDALQIETYQGGPAGADSSGSTSDTSAEIINAHNNNNGFANVLEGQADQYTPGQSGAPISQIDVQLGGITSGSNGGVGLAANMTLIPSTHSKSYTAFSAGVPGLGGTNPTPSYVHWDYYMTGSSSTGTNWSVDYLGNEFLAGNITATGIRDNASLTYTGSSVGLNNSSCGITVFDSNNSANTFTINAGLPVGCQADVVQEGTGTITFAGASGDSIVIHQRGTSPSHTSLGQYSRVHIIVDAATTTSGGSYVLSGDVNGRTSLEA